jgi:hypothetical protein
MGSVSWASGERMGATIARGIGALIVLTNCAPRQEADVPHPSDALVSEATLLPREVYLLALDSLLTLAHPETNPTFVQGSLPVTWGDLKSRHVQYREDLSVCPGETALRFLPPEKRDNGRVELEVVEAFGNHGLAGSRVFVFGGASPDYELIRTLPGDSDRLVACWGHKS